MKIEGNHWTIRMYRDYAARGGFVREPENLCRFLRVVTIWAPIRWLIFPREKSGVPNILKIVGTAGLLIIVAALYGTFRNNGGVAGLVPTEQGWIALGHAAFAAIVSLFAGMAGWGIAGLLKLYREKYKYARNGKMCPFIELDNGDSIVPRIPVVFAVSDTAISVTADDSEAEGA